ncbi:MAG: HlyD family efflux transporter periplasmic adaptor subunit [Pedobacter sp.]|nr:MAG: HlyD family efflux transporter periplasmic adaptor subunit [Pedobacter sp.]
MKYLTLVLSIAMFSFTGCRDNINNFDASGTFETTEILVSAELTGKILELNIEEGHTIPRDSVVGRIEATQITFQKQQVQESIAALRERTADVNPQVKLLEQQLRVQQSQLDHLLHEKERVAKLIKQDAATGKQLDDLLAQISVLQQQMLVTKQQVAVQKTTVSTQNRGIMSETGSLQKRVAQLDDQIGKSSVLNPATGTVIAKYAEPGELTTAGKPLYKIADLSTMYLRAYITGDQLSSIKLNQPVQVYIDSVDGVYHSLPGTISWIADKAEFTPKTIQTREERSNLVYALKIRVKNDGTIRIGMYGEVMFNKQP